MDEPWHPLWNPRLPWDCDKYIEICAVRLPDGRRLHCAHTVVGTWTNEERYRVYNVSETGVVGKQLGGAEDELGLRCILLELAYPGGNDDPA